MRKQQFGRSAYEDSSFRNWRSAGHRVLIPRQTIYQMFDHHSHPFSFTEEFMRENRLQVVDNSMIDPGWVITFGSQRDASAFRLGFPYQTKLI